MKSDIVKVTTSGQGIEDALNATQAAAIYRGLDRKRALHLRLLAEEMLGMLRQITNNTDAEFWVESQGEKFELHLTARPLITKDMRNELLKASSSGKNAAAKGFMGKIRDIFDRALTGEGTGSLPNYYVQGLVLPSEAYVSNPVVYMATSSVAMWSMNNYKSAVKNDSDAKDEWDELEKSIVMNVADEVEIAIAGDKVEMTVYKNFEN